MQNVYTVGQINSYIRRMFAEDFLLQELNIKGEVSNCKYHSSGHIYFTLKDMKGTISCVMFAGNRSGLSFRMTEGMQVVVQGTVDVYERDGKYQVYAKRITLDGEGALFERFQRLKEELLERGMFAPEYKKTIPKYIRTLGSLPHQPVRLSGISSISPTGGIPMCRSFCIRLSCREREQLTVLSAESIC